MASSEIPRSSETDLSRAAEQKISGSPDPDLDYASLKEKQIDDDQRRFAADELVIDKADDSGAERPETGAERPETGADNRLAAVHRDLDLLVGVFKEISGQLQDLAAKLGDKSPDRDEQAAEVKKITPDVDQRIFDVEELAKRPDQALDLAVPATSQWSTVDSELGYASNRWHGRWTEIWETLKGVGPRLWDMISRLVKVKEWTVTGQVGIPMLGLAQASISVTFGK